jgi:GDP-L-fucose synthase
MPTNLYGPNDNYDLQTSHVLPALLRKFHEAKFNGTDSVTLWGTGTPRREFLHVEDLADACYFLMTNYSDSGIVNVGVGEDISISELADMIKSIVGYTGSIQWDHTKPDGTPRKLMNVSRLSAAGWTSSVLLNDGIAKVYRGQFCDSANINE